MLLRKTQVIPRAYLGDPINRGLELPTLARRAENVHKGVRRDGWERRRARWSGAARYLARFVMVCPYEDGRRSHFLPVSGGMHPVALAAEEEGQWACKVAASAGNGPGRRRRASVSVGGDLCDV